jgi:hypothetical protein
VLIGFVEVVEADGSDVAIVDSDHPMHPAGTACEEAIGGLFGSGSNLICRSTKSPVCFSLSGVCEVAGAIAGDDVTERNVWAFKRWDYDVHVGEIFAQSSKPCNNNLFDPELLGEVSIMSGCS